MIYQGYEISYSSIVHSSKYNAYNAILFYALSIMQFVYFFVIVGTMKELTYVGTTKNKGDGFFFLLLLF